MSVSWPDPVNFSFSLRSALLLWRDILLLAVAYVGVAVVFSYPFALGDAGPFFPASGIALGALLIFGSRLWPGVWLGEFSLQFFLAVSRDIPPDAWWAYLGVTPCAMLLQVWLSIFLIHRYVKLRRLLERPHSILFLVLIVSFSSGVGALLSVGSMVMAQTLTGESGLLTALLWWMGDVIGILMVVPIMFPLFARPREYWSKHRLNLALPAVFLLAVCIFLLSYIHKMDRETGKTAFHQQGEYLLHSLQSRWARMDDMLFFLAEQIKKHPEISREEWDDLSLPWMNSFPGVMFLGYAPRVLHAERAHFESLMTQANGVPFRIFTYDAQGELSSSDPAPFYLPYALIAPRSASTGLFGLNLYEWKKNEPHTYVMRVLGTDETLASAGVIQMPPNGGQSGLAVSRSIYSARNLRPTGVVTALVNPKAFLHPLANAAEIQDANLCVTDIGAPPERRRVYGETGCEAQEWGKDRRYPLFAARKTFGDRVWEIRARAQSYPQEPWSFERLPTYAALFSVMLLQNLFFMLYMGGIQRERNTMNRRAQRLRRVRHLLRSRLELLVFSQRFAQLGSWMQQGERIFVSDELCRLLGVAQNDVHEWWQIIESVPMEARAQLAAAFIQLRQQDGEFSADSVLTPRGKEESFVAHFRIRSLRNAEGGRDLQGTVQNVTDRQRQETERSLLLQYDILTRLPNNVLWCQQVDQLLSKHEDDARPSLVVLVLDLSGMTHLNNTLGREAGDAALLEAVQRLSAHVPPNTLTARQSGDEFVFCLSALKNISEVPQIANTLIQCITRSPFGGGGQNCFLGANAGLALYPEDGFTAAALQKKANIALSCAKAQSRGSFLFFKAGMTRDTVEHLALENALRQGIPRNELILHYQPQIASGTRHVPSCEALVRWNHPDIGMVSPAQFIPLAEETGLIVPLGQRVFADACRQQILWAQRGMNLTIAVNISAMQFRREDFVKSLEDMLYDSGADPRLIELEITESALMQLNNTLLERIYQLKSMGFSLSLDDFGTGYSSLSYLKRLPIARLKLDQSFVAHLPHDLDNRAIATATLRMARELGMEVVAEGVETREQADFLDAHGCALLQGFFFGKPMPAERFESWLKEFTSPKPA
ncbi:MAG: EAL domain-containing protein [Zoogloeaceae bacterium]|nr:EAL domain-containing protein [Zoogloeaceae bacterium]